MSWCENYLRNNPEFCESKNWVPNYCCATCEALKPVTPPPEEEDPGKCRATATTKCKLTCCKSKKVPQKTKSMKKIDRSPQIARIVRTGAKRVCRTTLAGATTTQWGTERAVNSAAKYAGGSTIRVSNPLETYHNVLCFSQSHTGMFWQERTPYF